jgi:nicotinamide mononucleotide adenylyltransferase
MIKMADKPIYDIGVIHGRFQVLHNDHLKYLMAGRTLCRHLLVGITNPDPMQTKKEAADPKRSDPFENPLTYYERYMMVKTVLIQAGVHPEAFSIVPLPINLPQRYQYYVPLDAVFFLTIYDQWGRRKKQYFESLGLTTHLLWEVPPEQKGISAGDIRRRIRTGRPWEHLVPKCVPPLIERWRIAERLRQLQTD